MGCGRDGGPDHAATRKSGRDRDHCLNVRLCSGQLGRWAGPFKTQSSCASARKRCERLLMNWLLSQRLKLSWFVLRTNTSAEHFAPKQHPGGLHAPRRPPGLFHVGCPGTSPCNHTRYSWRSLRSSQRDALPRCADVRRGFCIQGQQERSAGLEQSAPAANSFMKSG